MAGDRSIKRLPLPPAAADPCDQPVIMREKQCFGQLPMPEPLGCPSLDHRAKTVADLAQIVQRDQQHQCTAQLRLEMERNKQPFRDGRDIQHVEYSWMSDFPVDRCAFSWPIKQRIICLADY